MKRFFGFCLLLVLSLPAAAQEITTPEHYASWRDRVVQVRVIDQLSGQKTMIGSGFVAGQHDWVVSNYHVISELVNQPGRYRAMYQTEAGSEGELELLAVDAVNDLSVLRAKDLSLEALPLTTEPPPKGSRIWAMGYPHDIGLTIVEGTYNGLWEKALYEKIHYTGSLNGGMSGGPTLDAAGQVVGVNVSSAGNQISFLVPVRFVADLLQRTKALPENARPLTQQVAAQLLHNQNELASSLLQGEPVTTPLNGYDVPGAMADYINCWGNSKDEDSDELALVYYRCQTQDDIVLSARISTGIIRFQHSLVSSENKHPLRFYYQLEEDSHYPVLRLDGDEDSVSNYQCRSDFVDRDGLALKVTFCARRYLKFAGLFDAYLEAVSLQEPRQALKSSLLLGGFDWSNLQRLSAHFLNSISRSADHD